VRNGLPERPRPRATNTRASRSSNTPRRVRAVARTPLRLPSDAGGRVHSLHRRIRSVLAVARWTGRPVAEAGTGPSLSWIGHRLGEMRDGQLSLELVSTLARGCGIPSTDPALRALEKGLREECTARSRRISRRVDAELLADTLRGNRPSREILRKGLRREAATRLRRRLARAEHRLRHDPCPRNLHRYRKRLRELVLLTEGPARSLRGHNLARVRDQRRMLRRLGRLHDLAVLDEWLASHGGAGPGRRIALRANREARQLRRRVLAALR
jgi:CHAD domain-containing protein